MKIDNVFGVWDRQSCGETALKLASVNAKKKPA
jgi:hypothetical protein